AAVAHWPAGGHGRGALLTGDTIQVVMDRRFVSFMWSYPNLVPLEPDEVATIVTRTEPYEFDRIYGAFSGRTVLTGAAGALSRSAERYLARMGAGPGGRGRRRGASSARPCSRPPPRSASARVWRAGRPGRPAC